MESSETIVSPVTGWFYRRTVLPAMICLAVSAWFFIDGFVVYPKKADVHQEYRAYTTQRALLRSDLPPAERQRANEEWERIAETYPEFEVGMEWKDLAERYGWALTDVPEWSAFAQSQGYFLRPAEKHRVVPADIVKQMVFGSLFLIGAVAFAGNALLSSKRTLRADDETVRFPNGTTVRFDRILRVDNRKWDVQGLAFIEARNDRGDVIRCKMDCLKYETQSARRIMDRILATPGIEVVTKKTEPQPDSGAGSRESPGSRDEENGGVGDEGSS